MANGYRIVNFRKSGSGESTTVDDLLDETTGKIKSDYISIDLVKVCTYAEDTPKGISWAKSSTETVTGTLEANESTRTYIYIVKDYDKSYYNAYVTVDSTDGFKWQLLVLGSTTDELYYSTITE